MIIAMMVRGGLASEEKKTTKPEDTTTALSPKAAAEIAALAKEKAARTPAQLKLDSHIVLAIKKGRGEPPFDKLKKLEPGITIQPDGRMLVDINATVTKELLEHIARTGGQVINSFEASHAIRAIIPLTGAESLAGRADIKFIAAAAQPTTNAISSPRDPEVPQSHPLTPKP